MRLRLSILSSLLLTSLATHADSGRVQFSATQSSSSIFDTDAMLPVWSNSNHMIYGDIAGGYGTDDTYIASPGLGYRMIHENQIFGAGLFADYERTSLGENFWVMSPAVEWMNASWDAHVNGYFPIQSRQQNGNTALAEDLGVYGYGVAHDYSYDDAYLTPYAVIGNGVDTAVGYSFDQGDHLRSRVFLGGYYYHPQDAYDVDNISGITAGYTKSLSKNFTVSLLNSYDNLNGYTLGINLTATLGGHSNEYSSSVQDRMLDPVERHIGIIDTAAGTNDQQSYAVVGEGSTPTGYMEPGGTGLGSAEHPAGMTQESLDMFNQMFPNGVQIFVAGGDNANYYVNSTTAAQSDDPNNDYGLKLYAYQDLYGRTANYLASATGDDRPNIIVDGENNYNAFIITGSENTLSGLIITTESGYINGSTPTTSTGIIAYNESEADQTIQITNTSISGFVDGMYAQNDSNTGTMTINTDDSAFDNNGGDQGLDNIQVRGYKDRGSAGLIAINNGSSNNQLIINATNSSFDNNGTFSGENSGINNNNVSVASGLIAINNSDTGSLTVNANQSTFNNNGTLSGANTYILANENGANGNSINIAAATGLYAVNNSNNDGAVTINAAHSSFNNNGTLSGENALIQAGGVGVGDNVNTAIAAGVYLFNNSIDSALITLNATDHSSFDNNGALSGSNSSITAYADNGILGGSENAAVAAGVFSFNDSNNAGSIAINVTDSSFDNNGALSGAGSALYSYAPDTSNVNESVVAGASGIFAYNSNNQGNNSGSITINADNSSFNNNGKLTGDDAKIEAQNDNGYGTGAGAMASASGISGYNIAAGNLTIDAINSEFHDNGFLSVNAQGTTVVDSNTDAKASSASGLFVFNNSGAGGNFSVTNLSGSSFDNNGKGTTGYGIYAFAPDITGATNVNYTGATFAGDSQINTNQGISDGTATWEDND